jgi:hypothetical protein
MFAQKTRIYVLALQVWFFGPAVLPGLLNYWKYRHPAKREERAPDDPGFAEDRDVLAAAGRRGGQDAAGVDRVVCFTDGKTVHLIC